VLAKRLCTTRTTQMPPARADGEIPIDARG
jgi:hypothetical protein